MLKVVSIFDKAMIFLAKCDTCLHVNIMFKSPNLNATSPSPKIVPFPARVFILVFVTLLLLINMLRSDMKWSFAPQSCQVELSVEPAKKASRVNCRVKNPLASGGPLCSLLKGGR